MTEVPVTVRVGSFNVNQFSAPAHQRADLVARMASVDVVLCQETVDLDLVAFAATQPGWAAFQERDGNSDGHANTGVLYRTSLGVPSRTVVVFIGDAGDTRKRYLTAVEFDGLTWYGSAHIFPKRDTSDIAKQLANIGAWVTGRGNAVVLGLDKNQCPAKDLEAATGLTWHGIDIDGFLTNVPIKGLAEFPKGFSDHPGVHATVTVPAAPPIVPEVPPVTAPKTSLLESIRALLRKAFRRSTKQGNAVAAARAGEALKDLRKPKPKPRLVAAPKPYALTQRDGHTIDQLTNYALYAVEKRLKFTPGSLTVVQGSYNGGAGAVSASAGTHDGGGVVDLTAAGWEEKVHALRAVGFAAWHRPFNWDGAGGGEHIHAVLIGNVKLSPSAGRQVIQYRNHTNGLANFGADNTWHPNPIPTFKMPATAQETA